MSDALTLTTNANFFTTARLYIPTCVDLIVSMAMLAMIFPPISALNIFSVGDWFQMIWINTPSIAAQMV